MCFFPLTFSIKNHWNPKRVQTWPQHSVAPLGVTTATCGSSASSKITRAHWMVCKGESVRSSWAPSKVSLAGDLLGALGHLGGFVQPKRMVHECGPQPLSIIVDFALPAWMSGCDFGISLPCQFVIHTQAYIVQSINHRPSMTFMKVMIIIPPSQLTLISTRCLLVDHAWPVAKTSTRAATLKPKGPSPRRSAKCSGSWSVTPISLPSTVIAALAPDRTAPWLHCAPSSPGIAPSPAKSKRPSLRM